METVRLNIPGMRSAHCQMTVTSTLENIGATLKSIAPSEAEIELTNGLTKSAVIQAIEKAGYRVSN
jgi:copper chaperone CopZ